MIVCKYVTLVGVVGDQWFLFFVAYCMFYFIFDIFVVYCCIWKTLCHVEVSEMHSISSIKTSGEVIVVSSTNPLYDP